MPTTNPVPSTDPTDLLFNAGKLDEVVNGTANSFTDRLGIARRTVAGMNADFDAQLADAESDLNVYRADAAASAAEALGYLQTIRATSYGAYASDPATDPLGNPPTVGDEYFNTTANLLNRWNGTTWQASDINTANLAASSGSSLVGYDGGTVQDVLDEVTGPTGAASVGYTPAGTGAVSRTSQNKMREWVSVNDFGAVGDGVTDNYAAITAAINHASYAYVNSMYVAVPTIYFPPGHYYCSQAINLKKAIRLKGDGSGLAGGHPTKISFPNGVDGFIVNRFNTNGASGYVASGTAADASVIEGLYIMQNSPTLQGAAIIEFNSADSQILVIQYGATHSVGDSIRVGDAFASNTLASATVSAVNDAPLTLTLSTSPEGFTVGETVTSSSGATGIVVFKGSTTPAICLKSVSGTFAAGNTITGGSSGATGKVSEYKSLSLKAYTLSGITGTFAAKQVAIKSTTYGTAIRCRARASIRDVHIEGWSQYGIVVVGDASDGSTNANGTSIYDSRIEKVSVDGIVFKGGDANAGYVIGADVTICGGWGINDSSQLGGYFFGCHVAYANLGSYRGTGAGPTFVACYSEGQSDFSPWQAQLSSLGSGSVAIGGLHGNAIQSPEYNDTLGYSIFGGGKLRLNNEFYKTSSVNNTGLKQNTFVFAGNGGAAPDAITLLLNGSQGYRYGPYIGARLGSGAVAYKDDLSNCVYGGNFGVNWYAYGGSQFSINLLKTYVSGTSISVSGGSPSRVAQFFPIISGGTITGLQICDPGAGYSSAPTVSGTGSWNGLTATTEILGGKVISVTVTAAPTGLAAQTAEALAVRSDAISPGVDNATSVGESSRRFSVVYAATGTINTSDGREKQDVADLDAAEKRVALALRGLVKKFRFRDAVDAKGGSARIHVGVIAQEVIATFKAEGLDPMRYAIICYDEWPDEFEDVMEEVTFTDENGKQRTEQQPIGEKRLIRAGGNRYGIRYEELLAFIIAAL